MIGELLREEQGRITGTRVLPDGKVEMSAQLSGRILGVEMNAMVTYTGEARPGGVLYGDGQGVIMTKDGETVAYTGQGIGRPKGDGAISWRGTLYHQTASQKLARLNNVATVFEYEQDATGNIVGKIWEWK